MIERWSSVHHSAAVHPVSASMSPLTRVTTERSRSVWCTIAPAVASVIVRSCSWSRNWIRSSRPRIAKATPTIEMMRAAIHQYGTSALSPVMVVAASARMPSGTTTLVGLMIACQTIVAPSHTIDAGQSAGAASTIATITTKSDAAWRAPVLPVLRPPAEATAAAQRPAGRSTSRSCCARICDSVEAIRAADSMARRAQGDPERT